MTVRRHVHKQGGSLMVVIPSGLVGLHNINAGDKIGFTLSGDSIILSTTDGPFIKMRPAIE